MYPFRKMVWFNMALQRSKVQLAPLTEISTVFKMVVLILKSGIHKAANNIAFICKKYYVQVLLKESGLLNTTSNIYQQVNDTAHNVLQQQNNTLDSVFGLKNSNEEYKCFPCIYWLPKKQKKKNLVQDL